MATAECPEKRSCPIRKANKCNGNFGACQDDDEVIDLIIQQELTNKSPNPPPNKK